MKNSLFTSDYKKLIFDNVDYHYLHDLFRLHGVTSICINVSTMDHGSRIRFLKIDFLTYNDDAKVGHFDRIVAGDRYPSMVGHDKPLSIFISVRKLLHQRTKFKIDTHPNKPTEKIKMNQEPKGTIRRIQSNPAFQGNIEYQKPNTIKVVNTIEVKEDQQTMRMNKGERLIVVNDSADGKHMVISFDLLETFYHAAKSD